MFFPVPEFIPVFGYLLGSQAQLHAAATRGTIFVSSTCYWLSGREFPEITKPLAGPALFPAVHMKLSILSSFALVGYRCCAVFVEVVAPKVGPVNPV